MYVGMRVGMYECLVHVFVYVCLHVVLRLPREHASPVTFQHWVVSHFGSLVGPKVRRGRETEEYIPARGLRFHNTMWMNTAERQPSPWR